MQKGKSDFHGEPDFTFTVFCMLSKAEYKAADLLPLFQY